MDNNETTNKTISAIHIMKQYDIPRTLTICSLNISVHLGYYSCSTSYVQLCCVFVVYHQLGYCCFLMYLRHLSVCSKPSDEPAAV